MLVKGDPGLLNAHILIKSGCNIPIHSKYVFQNISFPFNVLSDVFINYWSKWSRKKYWWLWFQIPHSKTPQISHTGANLLALCSVKWFSLAIGFSSYGVVGTSTTLLKWHFILLCTPGPQFNASPGSFGCKSCVTWKLWMHVDAPPVSYGRNLILNTLPGSYGSKSMPHLAVVDASQYVTW